MTKDLEKEVEHNHDFFYVDEAHKVMDSITGKHLPEMLFCHHFNCIPQVDEINNIDCSKTISWIKNNYKEQILTQYYERRSYFKDDSFSHSDFNVLLKNKVLIHLNFINNFVRIYYKFDSFSLVKSISKDLKSFQESKNLDKANISLVFSEQGELFTKSIELNASKVDLDLHYNDDFKDFHQIVLNQLNMNLGSGLVLLHGLPGSGKTNYLRFLFTQLSKEIIFLPAHIANNLSNAEILTFLLQHRNSILILEDSENIIINRQLGGPSVASILNIADGLLSDCLGIQFVCTFNTDLANIDKALLRKGRLIAKYRFGPLVQNKAQVLSDSLGFNTTILKDTVLSEIFHQDKLIGLVEEVAEKNLGFSINSHWS